MPGSHDGYILQEETGFKVRPPVIFKRAGESLRFRNLGGLPASIEFPRGLVKDTGPHTVPSGGSSTTFEILPTANGIFEYIVTVAVSGLTFAAVGDSGPKIIVDP